MSKPQKLILAILAFLTILILVIGSLLLTTRNKNNQATLNEPKINSSSQSIKSSAVKSSSKISNFSSAFSSQIFSSVSSNQTKSKSVEQDISYEVAKLEPGVDEKLFFGSYKIIEKPLVNSNVQNPPKTKLYLIEDELNKATFLGEGITNLLKIDLDKNNYWVFTTANAFNSASKIYTASQDFQIIKNIPFENSEYYVAVRQFSAKIEIDTITNTNRVQTLETLIIDINEFLGGRNYITNKDSSTTFASSAISR